jgi:hypothetical protein
VEADSAEVALEEEVQVAGDHLVEVAAAEIGKFLVIKDM